MVLDPPPDHMRPPEPDYQPPPCGHHKWMAPYLSVPSVAVTASHSTTCESISCFCFPENCTIDLASYGYDNSPRLGYIRTSGGSSEEIYSPVDWGINRGVTLVELDATTCTTRNRQRFDTFRWAQARLQVLETMESATAGTIIVGVTADTAEHNDNSSFKNIVGSFFTRYNMDLTELGFRDKFAFIMQKGYPQKTAFKRKPRYEESLRMAVALRGKF